MVTAPVDVPVLILVGLFDPAFRLIDPPDIAVTPVIVAPVEPVSNPAEVIVPVPVVEILPLVVTASPDVVGDSIVPVRFQYPRSPVAGGVVVSPLAASVYTPRLAVRPLSVMPVKV